MMVLMMIMTIMPLNEVKAADLNGNITIKNVAPGDTLVAYKIIDVDVVGTAISYSWASDTIANSIAAINGAPLTVNQFFTVTGDTEEGNERRQVLLSGLPQIIAQNPLAYEKLDPLENDTNAEKDMTWEDVEKGGYLIMPTVSTYVYQMILTVVQPIVGDGGEITTDDKEITPKREPVTITIEADKETVGLQKLVKITILADVPTYDDSVTKNPIFTISNTLPDGLEIYYSYWMGEAVSVYGYTTDRSSLSEATRKYLGNSTGPEWTMSLETDTRNSFEFENEVYPEDKYFSVTFSCKDDDGAEIGDDKSLNELGIKTIELVYYATIDEDTLSGKDIEPNTATMQYSFYPYVDGNVKTITDSVGLETFGFDITKVDNANNSIKLDGAKFEVFHKVKGEDAWNMDDAFIGSNGGDAGGSSGSSSNGELPYYEADEEGWIYIKVGEIEINNGEGSIFGIDEGEYHLKEIQPPAGYTLPDGAFEVVIDRNDTSGALDTNTNIYSMTIPNSKMFALPETGGTGTVIFTVVGVSLMCLAVLAFYILRKKEMNKN